jgi:hypothetical protein
MDTYSLQDAIWTTGRQPAVSIWDSGGGTGTATAARRGVYVRPSTPTVLAWRCPWTSKAEEKTNNRRARNEGSHEGSNALYLGPWTGEAEEKTNNQRGEKWRKVGRLNAVYLEPMKGPAAIACSCKWVASYLASNTRYILNVWND